MPIVSFTPGLSLILFTPGLSLILFTPGLSLISFTPGFSPVLGRNFQRKTVSTVFAGSPRKPLKRFLNHASVSHRAEARCE